MDDREKTIDDILSRSVAQVLPSKEKLKEILLSEKKLRIYIGADATGPHLHLGHATNFLLLEKLRKLGHEVIVLFGDFTALLGDPTGRLSERKSLSVEEVDHNISTWKSQLTPILGFDDFENPPVIAKNSGWLKELDLGKIIRLAEHFTVQQMLERDMFEKRIGSGSPVYLNEFLYPLLQGYDSVALDVDIEIGGTDQTFNMLAGRTLQKACNNKEKFVVTTTLLENPATGKKLMSKSEGNYIGLSESPNEMFGKVMALPDEVIIQMFTDCTLLPQDEISAIEEGLKEGGNPRDAKLRLAQEIVALYHGEETGSEARTYFIETFSEKKTPENIPEHSPQYETALEGFENIETFIARIGLATSKSDARRKIEQGGVELDGERVPAGGHMFSKDDDGKVLKVGKKDFVRIVF